VWCLCELDLFVSFSFIVFLHSYVLSFIFSSSSSCTLEKARRRDYYYSSNSMSNSKPA